MSDHKTFTLIGGPYDGDTVDLPADQDSVSMYPTTPMISYLYEPDPDKPNVMRFIRKVDARSVGVPKPPISE